MEAGLMGSHLNRNRNWTGWIKQRLDKPGTVFVNDSRWSSKETDELMDKAAYDKLVNG